MTAARPKAALFSADRLASPPGQGKISAEDAAKDATAALVAPPRTVADITAMVAVDFMRVSKLTVPDDLVHVRRWHDAVSARPSAKA